MGVEEGGGPKGSLADYVSKKLDDAVKQKTVIEESKARSVSLLIQRVAPLRARLQEQAEELNGVLSHFRVRELLEEVQNKFWKDSIIKKLEPLIYRAVVSQPDFIKTSPGLVEFFSSNFKDGDYMVGFDDFDLMTDRGLSGLCGIYGLSLERTVNTSGRQLRWHIRPGHYTWRGPGGGEKYHEGGASWEETDRMVNNVRQTNIMTFQVLRSGPRDGNTFYLGYDYRARRIDVKPVHESYLIYRRIVKADADPDVIRQYIGDRVIKSIS